MTIQWPKGMRVFYAALRDMSDVILGGTLVVVDPSIVSQKSKPGYAVFVASKLQITGSAQGIDHTATAYDRCRYIKDWISCLMPGPIDVFAMEDLPKALAHQYTLWAIGATFAGVEATHYIEVPIPFWKAYAAAHGIMKDTGPDGDALDARVMGEAMIAYCREVEDANA